MFGRAPSRWALAHIFSVFCFFSIYKKNLRASFVHLIHLFRTDVSKKLFTDHFSSRSVMCVSGQQLSNEMTFDLDIWSDGSP